MINNKKIARAESKKRKLEALVQLMSTIDERSRICVVEVCFRRISTA